ncbi:hypothetical protein VOLCADRAFT_119452 [Volvox carteri f. nagariensis]|uniref:Uncharacterized protein n=1 Tax=Volvox carteri f. nagariensis TaxID=3068 RepID=D8UD82_VOLCA|nr:uncharacterized protein VOLCADRAFT_119452 [Volvox carteri f. nagariensis]EFJ42386.1 hypothetical protein VOLCADRAFT_119452 [Volvox carteri f. nagariensis]|eukprot:XP_002956619.1 hypothetical protein VOLCADRAFT_119452 [Volvox carteri f. nagariensis]
MTHGKQKPLVPITREFLRQFYQKYPLTPVPFEARVAHAKRIEELAEAVTKPGSKVPEQVGMPSPTRIDDCFWRNRMICEEVALSISKLRDAVAGQAKLSAACERCCSLLVSAERAIFAVQEHNTASVKAQLQQFIPQDFRGALLERQRVSTEARYKKQVEDLVKRGGTIRQKYDLYLQQQWERRRALVQLGECSGMYKMVIKWVAGIPQVLLDFAKEINAKLGPMEEQRIKYGPDLYDITELGLQLNVALAAWVEAAAAAVPGARAAEPLLLDVVEPAVEFYCEEMLRVVRHIGDVFQHSPFFVNKDGLPPDQQQQQQPSLADPRGVEDAEGAPPDKPQHQDASSSTSAVIGDDGGTAAAAAAAAVAALPSLSLAPSVAAPPTPGLIPEASLLFGRSGDCLPVDSASPEARVAPFRGEGPAGPASQLESEGASWRVVGEFQGQPTRGASAAAGTASASLEGRSTSPSVVQMATATAATAASAPGVPHSLPHHSFPPGQQLQQQSVSSWPTVGAGSRGPYVCSGNGNGGGGGGSLSPAGASHLSLSGDSHASFLSALERQSWFTTTTNNNQLECAGELQMTLLSHHHGCHHHHHQQQQQQHEQQLQQQLQRHHEEQQQQQHKTEQQQQQQYRLAEDRAAEKQPHSGAAAATPTTSPHPYPYPHPKANTETKARTTHGCFTCCFVRRRTPANMYGSIGGGGGSVPQEQQPNQLAQEVPGGYHQPGSSKRQHPQLLRACDDTDVACSGGGGGGGFGVDVSARAGLAVVQPGLVAVEVAEGGAAPGRSG